MVNGDFLGMDGLYHDEERDSYYCRDGVLYKNTLDGPLALEPEATYKSLAARAARVEAENAADWARRRETILTTAWRIGTTFRIRMA